MANTPFCAVCSDITCAPKWSVAPKIAKAAVSELHAAALADVRISVTYLSYSMMDHKSRFPSSTDLHAFCEESDFPFLCRACDRDSNTSKI